MNQEIKHSFEFNEKSHIYGFSDSFNAETCLKMRTLSAMRDIESVVTEAAKEGKVEAKVQIKDYDNIGEDKQAYILEALKSRGFACNIEDNPKYPPTRILVITR